MARVAPRADPATRHSQRGRGFTHHRALAPVRWTGAALLVLEVGVVHLLVPAGPVRTVLLITACTAWPGWPDTCWGRGRCARTW